MKRSTIPHPKNPVRGYDLAGRVEAIADTITRFELGDEVFGTCPRLLADYAVLEPTDSCPKPANLNPLAT